MHVFRKDSNLGRHIAVHIAPAFKFTDNNNNLICGGHEQDFDLLLSCCCCLCTVLFVRLLDLATKDTEVDVKEIAVWALRIFITNSTCRKVRYFTAQMINFRVVLDAFNCCFHVDQ